jgi:hypothetical protein
MKSLNAMIKQLAALVDTNDLNDWENLFVSSVVEQTQDGDIVGTLSDKQVVTVQRIFSKHFAG